MAEKKIIRIFAVKFQGVNIKEVIATLERFAPLPLQESYDNAGLQIGLTEAEVSGVLLSLDVTEEVLQEAVRKGCNLVISHHPVLFHPLRQVSSATLAERCTRFAVLHGLTVYAAHTNLDNARDGVNFEIARRIGLEQVSFLEATSPESGSGIIGVLPEAMGATDFLMKIKQTFAVECLMHNQLLDRPIRLVALCGGAGDFLLDKAVSLGADAFLTGEMHYHQYFGLEGQIQIGVLGHYQSEQFTVDLLYRIMTGAYPGLNVCKTSAHTNPINYL